MTDQATCRDCGCGMWPATTRYTLEERREMRARGMRRKSGRNLCATCYQRHLTHGTLDELYPVWERSTEPRPCDRCGVRHRSGAGLCPDCIQVAADLHELDAWTGAR